MPSCGKVPRRELRKLERHGDNGNTQAAANADGSVDLFMAGINFDLESEEVEAMVTEWAENLHLARGLWLACAYRGTVMRTGTRVSGSSPARQGGW